MRYLSFLIGAFILITGWAGCERVTFPEEEHTGGQTGQPEDTLVIDSTGEGSLSSPATVMDVIEHEEEFMGFSCWVTGYIVGYTERTMKNASFTTEGAVQSNILLAQYPWITDVDSCVPVELKTDRWKQSLSLAHSPENLGKRIVVHGLVNTYFSVVGIRSIDDSRWLAVEDFPERPEKPENPEDEEPEQPEDPDSGDDSDLPDEPEEPDVPENPENPDDDLGDPYIISLNDLMLQLVDRHSALSAGSRYLLGTMPDEQGACFVASSMQYGMEVKYRRVLFAEYSDGCWHTEDGITPAIFVLEQDNGNVRLRDALTGGYLTYDTNGDASSTSWLPLYTLLPEETDKRFCTEFMINVREADQQIVTSEKIKYSAVENKNCLLRYNSSGNNFKLNYRKNGLPVYLFLLK